ncbi:nitrous oxide reductase family maturation protein NosD [Bacillus aquiflavi]|uniref:Nitrous oxide reductase family maturation protein NosD n=1 Tax=Bacillus aquiflavi TaxID=2672567 RepID=A0A6B3VXU2_9BACI|nr:nitrous oxide reductase family maturation protein NosD [Bacillus aquiflavi]MBA4536728.1 nitrous oxide reductase family maturation protein NosD [Bacillus aquiflavi]NEY81095.1 nitrous oxide reductase family maturation protein NosD [Bacillus aquiflavi]UAC48759.1 nitrous oxide reductase family maturation protein NosD [Bacillus aquiflavi]
MLDSDDKQCKVQKRNWLLYAMMFFAVFFVLFQKPAFAHELVVEEGQSIQAVIDQAAAGAKIVVPKGVFKENLTISKPITIAGMEGAVIDGGNKGNVITVNEADNVVITGLTIQNSGSAEKDSGIYLVKGTNNRIEGNRFINNHFGINVDKGTDHLIVNNEIKGDATHFSKRGNGIHLFKGSGHFIKNNQIDSVQDGVYFDFTKKIHVVNNSIKSSRYALHYMFSGDILTEENNLTENVTGLMVMDSNSLKFLNNVVTDHFHFRGFGVLIYDAKDIYLEGNEIIRNSTGISFEKGVNTETVKNIIAANQVGLEFIGENSGNIFSENNFISNIVQSKIANEKMRLDNGKLGNYWDDYGQFDVTGDGIGETYYKAGSLYDQLLRKQPYWQFFFESPAVKLWSKAESLFPSLGSANVFDELPAIEPFPLSKQKSVKEHGRSGMVILTAAVLLLVASITIIKGRKLS